MTDSAIAAAPQLLDLPGERWDVVSETLTFEFVDDLAFAADRGRLSLENGIPSLIVQDLGPFVEYLLLSGTGLLPAPSAAPWLSLNGTADLYSALTSRHHYWICPRTTSVGVFAPMTSGRRTRQHGTCSASGGAGCHSHRVPKAHRSATCSRNGRDGSEHLRTLASFKIGCSGLSECIRCL